MEQHSVTPSSMPTTTTTRPKTRSPVTSTPRSVPRCVQWATIDGRRYHVIGVASVAPSPTPRSTRSRSPAASTTTSAATPRASTPSSGCAITSRSGGVPRSRCEARNARRARARRLLALPDIGDDLRGAVASRSRSGVHHVPCLQPLAARRLGLQPRRPHLRCALSHAGRRDVGGSKSSSGRSTRVRSSS